MMAQGGEADRGIKNGQRQLKFHSGSCYPNLANGDPSTREHGRNGKHCGRSRLNPSYAACLSAQTRRNDVSGGGQDNSFAVVCRVARIELQLAPNTAQQIFDLD